MNENVRPLYHMPIEPPTDNIVIVFPKMCTPTQLFPFRFRTGKYNPFTFTLSVVADLSSNAYHGVWRFTHLLMIKFRGVIPLESSRNEVQQLLLVDYNDWDYDLFKACEIAE
jgi:hypothetical protein